MTDTINIDIRTLHTLYMWARLGVSDSIANRRADLADLVLDRDAKAVEIEWERHMLASTEDDEAVILDVGNMLRLARTDKGLFAS